MKSILITIDGKKIPFIICSNTVLSLFTNYKLYRFYLSDLDFDNFIVKDYEFEFEILK